MSADHRLTPEEYAAFVAHMERPAGHTEDCESARGWFCDCSAGGRWRAWFDGDEYLGEVSARTGPDVVTDDEKARHGASPESTGTALAGAQVDANVKSRP
jgi:hypothetical protein